MANKGQTKTTDVKDTKVVSKTSAVVKAEEEKKEAVKETKTVAKKAPAKKTTTEKKTTTKKATTTTAKKAPAKKAPAKKAPAKKAELKAELFIQYEGLEFSEQSINEKVIAAWEAEGKKASAIKTAKVYVKPQEKKAYFVINEKSKNGSVGSVDL